VRGLLAQTTASNQSLLWPETELKPGSPQLQLARASDVAKVCRRGPSVWAIRSVFPFHPQETEISSPLIERKGLLSYQDGFGGRKLELVAGARRREHGYNADQDVCYKSLYFAI
jgi:hypothetical protein